MNTPTPRTSWLLALLPLLLMLALGLRGIDANAIWLDETWSIYNAGGAHYGPLSPLGIIQRVATEDPRNAAPLYHLLLAGWGSLVGWTAFAARASSLLFGLLAVAWTYRLGRDLDTPLAGLGAALLLSTSGLFLYFTHELRTYMLATVFVPAALVVYGRLWRARRPSLLLYAGFVTALLGLLYTHYLAALTFAALIGYHVLSLIPRLPLQRERGNNHTGISARWWRITLAMGVAAALFLPWLGTLMAGMQLNAEQPKEVAYDAAQTLARLAELLSGGQPVLLLATLGLALLARRWRIWFFAAFALAGTLLANALFTLLIPGRERYLLMLWPLLAVLIGVGVALPTSVGTGYIPSLRNRRWAGLALSAALLLAWAVAGLSATLDGLLLRDLDGNNALPWDVLARTLAAEASPGDAAAVNITAYNWALEVQTADYHLHGLPLAFTLVEELPAEGFDAAARAFVGDAPRVWLGVDKRLPSRGGDAAFAAALAGQYVPCGIVFDLPRLRLDRYEQLPADAFEPGALGLGRFGEGITLVYADLTPQSALLAWRLDDSVPRGTYSVALHVVD
ncbi:MAG: glycosyltransferase family 39 protein, partial [Anaerolineae bacterium]|nr:glycosyltransferase family 39 protein [Anaerolineae bacterium]